MSLPLFGLIIIIIFFVILAQKSKKYQREEKESRQRVWDEYVNEVRQNASNMTPETFAKKYGSYYLNYDQHKLKIDEALQYESHFKALFIQHAKSIQEIKRQNEEEHNRKIKLADQEFRNKEELRRRQLQNKAELLISESDPIGWSNNKEKYQILYQHPKWKTYRALVIEYYRHSCMYCGRRSELQVHHPIYRGIPPWHYKISEVEVVCRKCHWKIHQGFFSD